MNALFSMSSFSMSSSHPVARSSANGRVSARKPTPSTAIAETVHPLVLFDGVCTLCNGVVRFIAERDPKGLFRFASLQSEAAQPLLRQAGFPDGYTGSLVLIEENGAVFTRSDAALRIAQRLDSPLRWAAGLRVVPRSVRDVVYDLIATYRYQVFGREAACPVPSPAMRGRVLDNGIGLTG